MEHSIEKQILNLVNAAGEGNYGTNQRGMDIHEIDEYATHPGEKMYRLYVGFDKYAYALDLEHYCSQFNGTWLTIMYSIFDGFDEPNLQELHDAIEKILKPVIQNNIPRRMVHAELRYVDGQIEGLQREVNKSATGDYSKSYIAEKLQNIAKSYDIEL